MRVLETLNYLHYGTAMDQLCGNRLQIARDTIAKSCFVNRLARARAANDFTRSVVMQYGPPRSRRVPVEAFYEDVERTEKARASFAALGCRGFSYAYVAGPTGFPYPLRSRIDLRFALVAAADLFFPPRVKKFLRRSDDNHYFVEEDHAIGFALGAATKSTWRVLALQSDLAYRTPAYVREHFRGWRKLLFSRIVDSARRAGARRVQLIRSEDVLRTCHPWVIEPDAMPASWRKIYDLTATEFGMRRVTLSRRVNIQLYPHFPPVYADSLYELAIG